MACRQNLVVLVNPSLFFTGILQFHLMLKTFQHYDTTKYVPIGIILWKWQSLAQSIISQIPYVIDIMQNINTSIALLAVTPFHFSQTVTGLQP